MVSQTTRVSKSGFPTEPDKIDAWWSEQKGKKLWQLQLYWLEWALKQEETTTVEISDEAERRRVISALEKAIEQIKTTEKPIEVKTKLVLQFK